jgi:hypothetical protein
VVPDGPGEQVLHPVGAGVAGVLGNRPAVSMPDLDVLRRCLALMQDAAAAGEAEPWQVAFLVDRVSLVERNLQVYGTRRRDPTAPSTTRGPSGSSAWATTCMSDP